MIEKLKNKFTIDQVIKATQLSIICLFVMLVFEVLFSFDTINNAFTSLVENGNGWIGWLGLWILMFLQTSIIPIPALPIFVAANSMSMITFNFIQDIPFYLIVMSAYMLGIIVAYWIGRKWGKKAVKWVAGSDEEYNKWAYYINKKGKWAYFITVLFPIFPDDLLCLVCGSVKFDFKFFIFANLVGRAVGLMATVYILVTALSTVGNIWSIILYTVCVIVLIILYYKLKKRRSRDDKINK